MGMQNKVTLDGGGGSILGNVWGEQRISLEGGERGEIKRSN